MIPVPRVSVVIPCFNHGAFLDEAVDSVLAQTFRDFEIVVVNDGSTDPATLKLLSRYDRPKTRVLHTGNGGLSSARNTGISNAAGSYIFPLDCDDRIAPTFLEKAVAVLDARPEAWVVYCDAVLFGEKQGLWELPPYGATALLFDNLILACAMYRKSDWQRVGGYSTGFRYGWEDWDFWLSLSERGQEAVKLPEPLYFYRIRNGSMNRSMRLHHKMAMMALLILRHRSQYLRNIGPLAGRTGEFLAKCVKSQFGRSSFRGDRQ